VVTLQARDCAFFIIAAPPLGAVKFDARAKINYAPNVIARHAIMDAVVNPSPVGSRHLFLMLDGAGISRAVERAAMHLN
jgi:hypothetical protein